MFLSFPLSPSSISCEHVQTDLENRIEEAERTILSLGENLDKREKEAEKWKRLGKGASKGGVSGDDLIVSPQLATENKALAAKLQQTLQQMTAMETDMLTLKAKAISPAVPPAPTIKVTAKITKLENSFSKVDKVRKDCSEFSRILQAALDGQSGTAAATRKAQTEKIRAALDSQKRLIVDLRREFTELKTLIGSAGGHSGPSPSRDPKRPVSPRDKSLMDSTKGKPGSNRVASPRPPSMLEAVAARRGVGTTVDPPPHLVSGTAATGLAGAAPPPGTEGHQVNALEARIKKLEKSLDSEKAQRSKLEEIKRKMAGKLADSEAKRRRESQEMKEQLFDLISQKDAKERELADASSRLSKAMGSAASRGAQSGDPEAQRLSKLLASESARVEDLQQKYAELEAELTDLKMNGYVRSPARGKSGDRTPLLGEEKKGPMSGVSDAFGRTKDRVCGPEATCSIM